MLGRKPKFSGKKTKWEIKREKRPAKRAALGKLPLVEPLTIAPLEERMSAFRNEKMVFYDAGKNRIELPLIKKEFSITRRLCGIYKMPDSRIISLRASGHSIDLYEVGSGGSEKELIETFFFRDYDLGHMDLRLRGLRGHGLGLKGTSKTEREQRAKRGGKHNFECLPQFVRIFERLGYENKGPVYNNQLEKYVCRMGKKGKFQPKDDLDKFFRIEAIDPKDGKVRIFSFPIEEKK